MALIDGQPSVLLQNVNKLIKQKVKDQVPLIEKFANTLYGNMSNEDLVGRNDSDLYGAALSLWQTFNSHGEPGAKIRVFNPEIAKYGWESKHTIVEIVVQDMPFLVDSVRMALSRQSITAHLLLHYPLQTERDKKHQIIDFFKLGSKAKASIQQTVFHIEIDRLSSEAAIQALTDELHSVMEDVSLAVQDWQPARDKLQQVVKDLTKQAGKAAAEEVEQAKEFLNWLAKDNFTLLGYREYTISPVEGDYKISGIDSSSLGLMRRSAARDLLLSELPESGRIQAINNALLILTKTNNKSRVHRPAYIDYVGVKKFGKDGKVIGEDRFIGLYSSSLYNNSAGDIPLLKSKLASVMHMSEFATGTHAYKALLNILETYPRDELIQSTADELLHVAMGVLQMQERDMTRLFMRKDSFGRFVTAMVYVPRERYNTQLRKDTQAILQRALGSNEPVEFTTYFSESVLARTHYLVRISDSHVEYKVKDIERNLVEAARTWEDKLESALLGVYGEARGRELISKYVNAFPRSYKEEMLPNDALVDIGKLESLNDDHKLEMLFYRPQEEKPDSKAVRLNLFHKDHPIHLSDVLPMLENFGLRVIGETPYAIKCADGSISWVLNFAMELNFAVPADFEAAQQSFQDSFAKVWNGQLEDDGFNRLILSAGLTGREASLLRAFAKYKRQIGGTFSQNSYAENTFSRYADLANLLVQLFNSKFDPKSKATAKSIEKLEEQISSSLENVANLDDDRIVRRFVDMINATLRTNYFQKSATGADKPYISFKIKSDLIPDMPLPIPMFEIFVYSPRVEGVHLRFGKVARGGLRWSDRREDFRTEVLGLVKAQTVKNTVIVPTGSKGGFVCKKLPETGGRDAFVNEGKECYRTFIRGLLDVTDNIVQGAVVPPQDVVRHDEDDPYLVVAADKGTATFSDISNGISEEYGFWMGDAFASGGSNGYDHKKMGITARGGWESVKRHFREVGINCQTTDFTCVGIGDMAGDVFGNGMLLSKHIRLQVAFNHMHIFIDPNPDSASSWDERNRLFNLPTSTWDDYNKALISDGGGIFLRSAKAIKLSPQMKEMLGSTKASMTPNELIREALMMQVDLIWNGGIGTYVKATNESHAEVGDRGSEPLRVNGRDLKAKVIGEGGNLGATQRGRIEFAMNGGLVNTDFVDNVGGVTCSDNEVNIKILLNTLVAAGDLTLKQRNKLLLDMTDDVTAIVLKDCYRQTQSISISSLLGGEQLKEYTRFIHTLEKEGKLNRELEFLPTDDELAERMAKGQGLTRPELSILTAYGKMVLKERLVLPEIFENEYFKRQLFANFPQMLQDKYAAEMENHPLKAEIIATKLANMLVNEMGPNFTQRMQEETGAGVGEVTLCYAIARDLFDLSAMWRKLEQLDNVIPAALQTKLLHQLRRTMRRATRWFLRHRNKALDIQQTVDFFKPAYQQLSESLGSYLAPSEAEQLQQKQAALVEQEVPEDIAQYLAQLSTVFSVMDIAQVADTEKMALPIVSEIYFKLGDKLDLHWFLEQITNQPVANHWQALARASYREELDWQQRALSAVVVRSCDKKCAADEAVTSWVNANDALLERWRLMLSEFKTTKSHEFAKFSVALRELMLLSHHCDPVK